MTNDETRSGPGRRAIFPGGTRWVSVPIPDAFAKSLVNFEGRHLRDILADAVRAAYPQFKWDGADEG